jgi:2-hydroxychromene-2-carboxylate isomerase
MTQRLEFFFDVQCPFAYLASTQVRALAEACSAELVYKPILLGGLYNALEDGGPYKKAPAAVRTKLVLRDALRWADHWGVPLKFPPGHPVRSVLAMRAILASNDIPKATHALFDAAWGRGQPISDRNVIAEALRGAGFPDVDAILARAESEAIKDDLHARTAEAASRGAFGVPTFFVGEQMFWGQDRLDFVARALGAARFESKTLLPSKPVDAIDIWFDYSSPFAYLAVSQIERIAEQASARLTYRPFLLGGLFREIGTPDVPMLAVSEAKRRYMGADMLRWAEHWGVPFRFPSRFPMRTIAPLRATCELLRTAPNDAPRFIQGVYRAFWADDRNISDDAVLKEICNEVGIDPGCVERANDAENKQALLQAGQEAKALGLCGAPTCVVGGRLFWGQDRLGFVQDALAGWAPACG